PDRPVLLYRADGRSAVANSPALAEAGLARTTGSLSGSALTQVERAVPPPLPLEQALALAKAQELLIADGLTSVTDIGTTIDDWMTFRRAGDLGNLRLRITAYAAG